MDEQTRARGGGIAAAGKVGGLDIEEIERLQGLADKIKAAIETPDQKAVFAVLRCDEALFVDSIIGLAQLPQPRVLGVLLELEMSGLIRQLPGKNFIRKL